jgi:hypothetical protein
MDKSTPTDVEPSSTDDEVIVISPIVTSNVTDLSFVTWDNLDSDISGIPVGFQQKFWNDYMSIDLRSICSCLFVKGCKNFKKTDMIESITKTYHNNLMILQKFIL